MRIHKITLLFGVLACLLASCNKAHYDMSQVHGFNAEGEALLPIAHKSLSMMEMMERFQLDSVISCADDGSMSFNYFYEHLGILNGDELLRFKDLSLTQHFEYENVFGNVMPSSMDTVVSYQQTLVFQADHIGVLEAWMKSGHLEFTIASNVGVVQKVILRTDDIEDAEGHVFVREFEPQSGSFGFDLEGLHYHTDAVNTLRLSYELHCASVPTTDAMLFIDFKIEGNDLAFSKMTGYVEPYDSRDRFDTIFSLFPDNLTGVLDVKDVKLTIDERNTFCMGGQLMIDTALMMGEGIEPYSLFEPMPVEVELPPYPDYTEVYSEALRGRITSNGGSVSASTLFTVNAMGMDELVTISDTCSLDVQVNVMLPFAFNIMEVQYLDTVDLTLNELELPAMIERLTLELTFTSTLPVNLMGYFYMYDSEQEVITDTLVDDGQLIAASFDGAPTHTTLSIDLTEERMERVMQSDRIIMRYLLDTDAHDVVLNANQRLTLYVKARAQYNAKVEFDN